MCTAHTTKITATKKRRFVQVSCRYRIAQLDAEKHASRSSESRMPSTASNITLPIHQQRCRRHRRQSQHRVTAKHTLAHNHNDAQAITLPQPCPTRRLAKRVVDVGTVGRYAKRYHLPRVFPHMPHCRRNTACRVAAPLPSASARALWTESGCSQDTLILDAPITQTPPPPVQGFPHHRQRQRSRKQSRWQHRQPRLLVAPGARDVKGRFRGYRYCVLAVRLSLLYQI